MVDKSKKRKKEIKVLYDYQIMLGQKYGGISRYFFELIQRFKLSSKITPKLYCLFNDNTYFSEGKNHRGYSKIRGKNIANRFYMKFHLRLDNYDIFHPTYYDPYFLNYNKGKLVLTVYDMIHELLPEFFSKEDKTADNKRLLIHKADRIIAISESTKKDILRLYPEVDEDKITVIYIGSNFQKANVVKEDSRFPMRYVLFVGNRSLYKNFDKLYDSVIPILKEDENLHLVCIGGGKFTEQELIKQKEFAGRIHQMNVDDQTLAYAYSHAICFIFPSLYEGFGIPTLEAFACDCPVILSNTSSMPEVGGDAVTYINPHDVCDMTIKIRKVLNDEELRNEMRRRGRKQLEKFDWDKIAEQTIECYKEVLNEG